ncbi:hypothetical protein JC606_14460 [Vibrio sp. IB15]|uniref:hypothetical protein n=1 Tax=Vibrio sp. IB15 TaxID=2779368 RepID=UPI0018E8E17D|nr:hypothetical protein [Vibrio sp. IB15]MBJ2147575.1 hypothetical protein [Vibrio sp. IB15]
MFKLNNKKNQHYYSVVEQKLNSKNPESGRKKRKIYRHEILNKKELQTFSTNERGISCEKTLAELDTFTFYIEGKNRYNFEEFFEKYELKVELLTKCVTQIYNVRSNVELDIKELTVCKFVNIIRNPYNIRFINKFFSSLDNSCPRASRHNYFYEKILSCDIGSIKHLSKIYGVTPDEYKSWLAKIFFCVSMPYKYSKNYLESFIDRLLNSDDLLVTFDIKNYSEPCVLLSDRGYIDNSMGNYTLISFNLSSNSFFILKFITIFDILTKFKNLQINDKDLLTEFKEYKRFHHDFDDFDALRGFNRSSVYFSQRYVYSGFREIKYL